MISDFPARTPTDSGNAAELPRWADDCARQADDPRVSGDERQYLLTKHRSLMALAAAEGWLGGDVSPHRTH